MKNWIKKLFTKEPPKHIHNWRFEYATGDALSFDKRARVYRCDCGKFGLQEYGKGNLEITELK